ncbi:IS3 family transposase [Pseudomonas sp. SWRI154]|uniref:IS3 family transposase n=1 Tax=Pseudomonas sp. SWRI154 TaxID=2745501 RepID=UPI0016450D9D|nr:IS3 family transposase [Pseudomonas sp. SWRI154]MBC3366563.1 IS3 family transposase [Pseudomonas sp. SWRI154]
MSKYTSQFKLSAITAFLERGRGFRFVAAQFQMDPTLLRRWVEAYRLHGDASLQVRSRVYSPEFKLGVLQRMWQDKLSLRRVAALFNLGNSSQVGRWQQQYYSGGFEALVAGKGLNTAMPLPPDKIPDPTSPSDDDLSHAQLLIKLRKLQVENAWLKKLKVPGGEEKAGVGSRQKTTLVTELREHFMLDELLLAADLPRSTYYYQAKVMAGGNRLAPLKAAIQSIQDAHKGRYGYRRMTAALRNEGLIVNSKTVRRLMDELGLKCTVRPKKYRSYRGLMGEASPNTLARDFEAEQPNQKWVTDVTEFKVAGEKLYLSPVLDLYNGEIVAYQTATRPRYCLVGDMLEKALEQLPEAAKPMLHSDQGWHYRYPDYRERLEKAGLDQSMSRKGNCLDNATMESFFGTLKSEYFYRERFDNVAQLQAGLDEYIHYYNHDRIKMKLGGLSPVAYRAQSAIA